MSTRESSEAGVDTAKAPAPADESPAAVPATRPAADLVPGWLAILVLVLIVALVGAGGFVARGLLDAAKPSPGEADLDRWKSAVARDSGDAQARLSLAYAYQREQRYDEALAEYKAVLALRPRDTAALYNIGVIHMISGRGKEGEIALWDVLEVDPANALAARELGEYYAAKRQFKSLLRAIGPALEARPTLADLQYLAGLADENLGDAEGAKGHYSLALRYAPDSEKARSGLARLGVTAP
jgi:tetratricopeptide (TPR) repeat protein